jgi:DNA-binding response OmpR family regulator
MPAPTILIVNHDADTCEILRVLLRYQGYWTIDLRTVEEVRAAIAAERPALVVSELYVPSAQGLCVLGERLKVDPATARVRILVLTSNVTDDRWKQLPLPVCDGFLTKPFELRVFEAELRRLLGPEAATGPSLPAPPPPSRWESFGF